MHERHAHRSCRICKLPTATAALCVAQQTMQQTGVMRAKPARTCPQMASRSAPHKRQQPAAWPPAGSSCGAVAGLPDWLSVYYTLLVHCRRCGNAAAAVAMPERAQAPRKHHRHRAMRGHDITNGPSCRAPGLLLPMAVPGLPGPCACAARPPPQTDRSIHSSIHPENLECMGTRTYLGVPHDHTINFSWPNCLKLSYRGH